MGADRLGGIEAARKAVACPSSRRSPMKANPDRIVRLSASFVHPSCDVTDGPRTGQPRVGCRTRSASRLAGAGRRPTGRRLRCSGCPSLPVERAAARSTRWRRSSRCSWRSAAARAAGPSSTTSAGTTNGAAMCGGRIRPTIPGLPRTSAGRRSAGRHAGGSLRAPDGGQVETASSGRGGSTSR
jgi:hypothetical protein